METIRMRSPIFVSDLAKAIRRTEAEIIKVLLIDLHILSVTGLIDDDIAIEVARRLAIDLRLLQADPEVLQRARDERSYEENRFYQGLRKRGKNLD